MPRRPTGVVTLRADVRELADTVAAVLYKVEAHRSAYALVARDEGVALEAIAAEEVLEALVRRYGRGLVEDLGPAGN